MPDRVLQYIPITWRGTVLILISVFFDEIVDLGGQESFLVSLVWRGGGKEGPNNKNSNLKQNPSK
jgi:hypothetical protein